MRRGRASWTRPATARHRQIRRLVRDNKRLIETDPNGEPMVRSEIIAVGMSEEALARRGSRGFVVEARNQPRRTSGSSFSRRPKNTATRRRCAIYARRIRSGLYDYNHIYLGSRRDGRRTRLTRRPPMQPPRGRDPPVCPLRSAWDSSTPGSMRPIPRFGESVIHPWGCGVHQAPGGARNRGRLAPGRARWRRRSSPPTCTAARPRAARSMPSSPRLVGCR